MFNLEEEWELPYQQYIAAGFRVIPLYPIIDGKCGCGWDECKAAGKHPKSSAWQHTPEWSSEQLATMREFSGDLYPALGVLIRDGLLIVDVDERNGGVESFQRLQSDTGIKIKAGFSVRTGSGGGSMHHYFRVTGEPFRLRQSLKEYPGIDFKFSGFVVGWGSPHVSGMYYEREMGFPEDVGEPPAGMLELLKAPEHISAGGEHGDITLTELAGMLACIPNNDEDYEHYLTIGMAIHSATDGAIEGASLWHEWAQRSSKYDARDVDRRWHSFGKYPGAQVTIGTLVKIALDNGYETPVTFDADAFCEDPPAASSIELRAKGIQPWDMPGAAGRLYQWIDGQCRYPRPTIAAGATLYALSSIGGMRHYDQRDGLPLNLMVFTVAGTGTGKESIGQAVTELFSRVGIVSAMHGKIKSEQEIYRNLIDHKAALYQIDEFGILLQKISNATKSGGAVYLTGVIGALMEIYSKANGILAVTGDLKKEIKEMILRDIAQIVKREDDGRALPTDPALLELKKEALRQADQGIHEPYLTVMGTTTPTTFDSTITPENAQNGFIARALILREHEDNPRWRAGFKRAQLDFGMEALLSSLYYGGHSHSELLRVDCVGEKQAITTTPEASALLDEAYEYFWQLGEVHKDRTGLVGITRRGWEMASKISLVLAMADGSVRTEAHVLYGFAMSRRDVNLKIEYAYSADDRADNSVVLRLLSRLDEETGATLGQVKRILRGVAVDGGLDGFLEALEARGLIRVEECKPEGRGRPTKKIYRV